MLSACWNSLILAEFGHAAARRGLADLHCTRANSPPLVVVLDSRAAPQDGRREEGDLGELLDLRVEAC